MMDDLKERPQCSDFLRDFIKYIKEDILVIDASCRATSPHITKKLQGMYGRCQTSPDYCCKTSSENSMSIDTRTNKLAPMGVKKCRKSADHDIAANGRSDLTTSRLRLMRWAKVPTQHEGSSATIESLRLNKLKNKIKSILT